MSRLTHLRSSGKLASLSLSAHCTILLVRCCEHPLESEQSTSIDHTRTLDEHGVLASIGSVGATTTRSRRASSTPSRPSSSLIAAGRPAPGSGLAVIEYVARLDDWRGPGGPGGSGGPGSPSGEPGPLLCVASINDESACQSHSGRSMMRARQCSRQSCVYRPPRRLCYTNPGKQARWRVGELTPVRRGREGAPAAGGRGTRPGTGGGGVRRRTHCKTNWRRCSSAPGPRRSPSPRRTARPDVSQVRLGLVRVAQGRVERADPRGPPVGARLRSAAVLQARHRISQITVAEVDRYRALKVRQGRLSAASINRTITWLAHILEVAIESGVIKRNSPAIVAAESRQRDRHPCGWIPPSTSPRCSMQRASRADLEPRLALILQPALWPAPAAAASAWAPVDGGGGIARRRRAQRPARETRADHRLFNGLCSVLPCAPFDASSSPKSG
jgi:hypothetical protein